MSSSSSVPLSIEMGITNKTKVKKKQNKTKQSTTSPFHISIFIAGSFFLDGIRSFVRLIINELSGDTFFKNHYVFEFLTWL